MYHYASNNPVRYIAPDGNSATGTAIALGEGIFIAYGTKAAIVAGAKAIGAAAASITPAGWVVIGAVVVGGIAYASYKQHEKSKIEAHSNAKVSAKTKNRNNNYSITFQAQGSGMHQNIRKGSTQGSKVIQVFSDKPITKEQAWGALTTLYAELTPKEQENMRDRFEEAAEWIKNQKYGCSSSYKSIQPKINPTGNRIDIIFKGGYNLVSEN